MVCRQKLAVDKFLKNIFTKMPSSHTINLPPLSGYLPTLEKPLKEIYTLETPEFFRGISRSNDKNYNKLYSLKSS